MAHCFSRSSILRLAKLACGVALLGVLLISVNIEELWGAFSQISLLDVIVLVTISAVLIAVSVIKWRLFLRHLGIEASFVRLFGLYLVGYFVNVFTPSFIGGDVVRSLALGTTVNRSHAVAATFLERYTGIVAMLAMAVCAASISDVVTPQIRWVVLCAVLGCACATWFVAAGWVQRLATVCKLPQKVVGIAERVHAGLRLGMGDRSLVVQALLLSVVFHLLTIVNTIAVGSAVGWHDIPWRGLLVVVPLILLIGAVPLSPQGLGIQEGAFVFFLHSVGATTGQALAVALVLRAKSYLLALLGGTVWLLGGGTRWAEAADASDA